jgi:hypothetical protein
MPVCDSVARLLRSAGSAPCDSIRAKKQRPEQDLRQKTVSWRRIAAIRAGNYRMRRIYGGRICRTYLRA